VTLNFGQTVGRYRPRAERSPIEWQTVQLRMALYEYLCRDCQTSFEVRRPMGEVDSSVTCPSGHTDVRRKLSAFSSVGVRATAGVDRLGSAGSSSGSPAGGCCGGACGCGR